MHIWILQRIFSFVVLIRKEISVNFVCQEKSPISNPKANEQQINYLSLIKTIFLTHNSLVLSLISLLKMVHLLSVTAFPRSPTKIAVFSRIKRLISWFTMLRSKKVSFFRNGNNKLAYEPPFTILVHICACIMKESECYYI